MDNNEKYISLLKKYPQTVKNLGSGHPESQMIWNDLKKMEMSMSSAEIIHNTKEATRELDEKNQRTVNNLKQKK